MSRVEGGPEVKAGRIAGLDTSVAHPARVYDYWLGGKDNFAPEDVFSNHGAVRRKPGA